MEHCEIHGEVRDQVKDHEKRIVALEKTDAEFTVMIKYMCEKMDSLITWFKGGVIAAVVGGGGFIIWYIQSLPR